MFELFKETYFEEHFLGFFHIELSGCKEQKKVKQFQVDAYLEMALCISTGLPTSHFSKKSSVLGVVSQSLTFSANWKKKYIEMFFLIFYHHEIVDNSF